MKGKDIIKVLQTDVEIPVIVQESADAALQKIVGKEIKKIEKKKFPKKRTAVIIAAAILVTASISAAAAYVYWSKSLGEGMQISEEQKIQLQEKNAVVFPEQDDSIQDIKITAVQSITDNYFAHIVFKIEGYQIEENEEPCFENIEVSIDGKENFNWSGSFYNGLIMGIDGQLVYADGTPLKIAEHQNIEHYAMEDGSMEYHLQLGSNEKGYFLNKTIHVELSNLGTVKKAEYFADKEGNWKFEWNLQGTKDMKEVVLQETLGDTSATVTKVEMSPISFHVEYNFPRNSHQEIGIGENGEEIYSELYEQPPMLKGVKLKNGTLYPYLDNGGSCGYVSEESDFYYATFAMDRIIDVSQVESLLFAKSYPSEGEELTEENFYVIPMK